MTKKNLKFFKSMIIQKIKDLRIDIESFEKASYDESSHLSQDTSATMNVDIDQCLMLADREGKFLFHLEDALLRIEQKTFGQCSVCEELISEKRLKAVPVAKMCIICKQKKEQTSK